MTLTAAQRREKFGTHGEDLLVSRYCELYWQNVELQTIGTEACMTESMKLETQMYAICEILEYVPEA